MKEKENIELIGGAIKEIGEATGGETGSKLEAIGNFIMKHQDKAAGVIGELKKTIDDGDFKIDGQFESIMGDLFKRDEKAKDEALTA